MIEHVPVIGDILLDEYKNRQHNENEIRVWKTATYLLTGEFRTFSQLFKI